ncbi:unnamed protein product [Haemonchus placei]|uniref:Uncharacterized protein n=1 Tax=Haemonchus placei TaxID=6290 RepID=A0A0N4WEB2_HAEPC|nr:unnamed protein product [Haemonchus placei]
MCRYFNSIQQLLVVTGLVIVASINRRKPPTPPPSLENDGAEANLAAEKFNIFDSLPTYRQILSESLIFGTTLQGLLRQRCGKLSEQEKTRLLINPLDEDCHQFLYGSIAPRQPTKLSWDEAIATVDLLFGSAKASLRLQLECFKVRYDYGDFNSYEALVRTQISDVTYDFISFDGL